MTEGNKKIIIARIHFFIPHFKTYLGLCNSFLSSLYFKVACTKSELVKA